MKTVKEATQWFEQLGVGGALYVWGMNGDIISDATIAAAYRNYKSNRYDYTYYKEKLQAGEGKIGADCSGAFYPIAGSDNTAAGYLAGCIQSGKIATIPQKTPCMVFKRNAAGNIYHIGWHHGDGTVSEMASSAINYRRRALASAGWTDWGIPKFIDYTTATVASAQKSGWVQENGEWRFYLDNERYVTNDWYRDEDGKWYWFRGDGMMVSNTWYQYHGNWYYLGADGAMLTGLQDINGNWYYMDPDGAMATAPVTLMPDADGALQYPGLKE